MSEEIERLSVAAAEKAEKAEAAWKTAWKTPCSNLLRFDAKAAWAEAEAEAANAALANALAQEQVK